MAFASNRPFLIKIKDSEEDGYLGNLLHGPTLRRLRELALDPKYGPMLRRLQELALNPRREEHSFLGASSSITKRLKHDFLEVDVSASQIDYELCVMMSGPNSELWTPDMESSLIESYKAKICNSVFEITFALIGKFRVGLTDQETYKKLQQLKLEGKTV